jgi:hypothetical protein
MGGLALNLLSEGVGIVITVLVIDRIIKCRDEASWRPAKRVIHDRVATEIIEPLLNSSSRLVQDIVNREYWDRFISDETTSVDLRRAARDLANDARNEITDLFDSVGLLIGPELSNMLQTLNEQLRNVLDEEREVAERLRDPLTGMVLSPSTSRDQVMAAMEPLSVRIREAASTASQTKASLETEGSRGFCQCFWGTWLRWLCVLWGSR